VEVTDWHYRRFVPWLGYGNVPRDNHVCSYRLHLFLVC